MSNGHHFKGVAIGISRRLQPSVVEVTSVYECIMRLRLKHSKGFMSVVAVHAPTEVCKTEERKMFYAKFYSKLEQCPRRYALVVLGDFNAVTGTERAYYGICVASHGSGTRNDNNPFLLNFARSRGVGIAGS